MAITIVQDSATTTENSIGLYITGLRSCSTYNCQWNVYKDGDTSSYDFLEWDLTYKGDTSGIMQFTNLDPGTYLFVLEVRYDYTSGDNFVVIDKAEGSFSTYGIPGSGDDDDYVPSFDNLAIAEDTSKKTSSRLGVYLTGLDTNFKGTWEITQLYTKSGTYYVYAAGNGNPSITFSGGKSKSDIYLLTGLNADTSHRIHVTLQCTVNGTVYKKTIQSTSYFYTDEPDDSYYPDLDDFRVVIESIGTNRITVHAEGLDPNYSYGDWEILWHIIETNNGNSDWELVYDEDIPAGSTETGSVFITELKQNTYYDIRVTVRFRYNGSWYSEYAFSPCFSKISLLLYKEL